MPSAATEDAWRTTLEDRHAKLAREYQEDEEARVAQDQEKARIARKQAEHDAANYATPGAGTTTRTGAGRGAKVRGRGRATAAGARRDAMPDIIINITGKESRRSTSWHHDAHGA